MLRQLLAHPLTKNLDIDKPHTTELRRQIIKGKPFLQKIYQEWYRMIASLVPSSSQLALELGAGAGFLSNYVPGLITSEILPCRDIAIVLDGQKLPFADSSLRAIVMTDVLHHIPDCRAFFAEASRCLIPSGRIVMIEPWVSRWSKFIYTHLHHEPFWPESPDWSFPQKGPLSGANQALPWLVFERDRGRFEKEFPTLITREITPIMPFRYLLSGGVSMRSLAPGFSYQFWSWLESPFRKSAMFALILVERL